MKRPMLLCGSCAILLSCAALLLSAELLLIFALVFAVLLLSAIGQSKINFRFLIPAFVICLLIALHGYYVVGKAQQVQSLEGDIVLSGTICDLQSYGDSIGYTVRTDTVNGQKLNTKIELISIYGLHYGVGDKITANAELYSEDISSYALADGTFRTALLGEVISHKSCTDINTVLHDIRQGVSRVFLRNISFTEASVMLGLTTGDTAYIPDALYENIHRSGISHIIVVSGLHLAIITGGFIKLAGKMGLGLRLTGIIGFFIILCIGAVTGFTVSSLRAGLTYFIIFAGYFMGRRPDPLNSLFAAMTLIILQNPFAAGSVSFQLSSAATFGIIAVSPRLLRGVTESLGDTRRERAIKGFLGVMFSSLSATLMTLPFTIWHFGTVSFVAVITNLAITYPVTWVLVLCVLSLLCYGVGFLFKTLLLLAGVLTKVIIYIVNSLGSLPFASATLENRLLPALFAGVAAAAVAAYCLYKIDDKKGGDQWQSLPNRS